MDQAITTHELTRGFPSGLAVDGLSLDVARGEVLALLGPNGAGKTTTVRLLNGVLRPDRGSSRVLGLDPVTQGDELRRLTGVLTEHAGLDERLTAAENLELTARMRGMDNATAERRSRDVLERFGMTDKRDDVVQGFSTGQRKRLALGRALLHDPEVLFLDEPTSGLDPTATREVIDLIGTLASEHGRTIVLCTHFLGEAGRLAHRMAVLHLGRLHAFGRPEEIAAELWHGLDADVDLGRTGDDSARALVAALPGVLECTSEPDGLMVRVTDRDVLPRVVAALVHAGHDVYAAVPRPPTLEDVYFAVEARIREGAQP